MKHITHTLLISLSISLLLLLLGTESCKKDIPTPIIELDKLPPATQTGKNTYGCLINGKASYSNGSHAFAAYQMGFLQIAVGMKPYSIRLSIDGSPHTNVAYDLTDIYNSSCALNSFGGAIICEYKELNTLKGSLTLTRFDTVVSGTFQFETYISPCDTIRVTNGRFDLPLYL